MKIDTRVNNQNATTEHFSITDIQEVLEPTNNQRVNPELASVYGPKITQEFPNDLLMVYK